MKKNIILVVFCFFCLNVSFAETGNTAGLALLEDIGARSIGISGACSSLSGDISYFIYNPASLVGLKNSQLVIMYYNIGLTDINSGSITYNENIGEKILGLNIFYLNAGKMDLNSIDGSSKTVTSEQDIVGRLGLAIPLGEKINLGISAKIFPPTLNTSVSSSKGKSSTAPFLFKQYSLMDSMFIQVWVKCF